MTTKVYNVDKAFTALGLRFKPNDKFILENKIFDNIDLTLFYSDLKGIVEVLQYSQLTPKDIKEVKSKSTLIKG